MSNSVIWILVLVHVIGALLFLVFRYGRLDRRKEYLVPILCVPVFGPLLAFTIDLLYIFGKPASKEIGVEALKLEQNVYWNSIKTPDGPSVVPLEEAILIDDKHTRRELVLDTFRHDAFRYLDVLMLARDNEDADTTHYATIRITKIHRKYQLALQQYAVEHEKDPQNLAVLNGYLDLLEEYISSPLPDELMLRRQKMVYAGLLDQKLALQPGDHSTMLRKLRYYTTAKEDFGAARALADQLQQRCPADEDVWTESLRLCVECHDRERLEATIERMQSAPINWTRQGRALVRPWLPIEEKQPAGVQP
jgi:hypothetical protein